MQLAHAEDGWSPGLYRINPSSLVRRRSLLPYSTDRDDRPPGGVVSSTSPQTVRCTAMPPGDTADDGGRLILIDPAHSSVQLRRAAPATSGRSLAALTFTGGSAPPPPPSRDVDRDGVLDDLDNCPSVRNPDQRDANFNGIGDACEAAGLLFASAAFLQALDGGGVAAEVRSVNVAEEPPLAEQLAKIVAFRVSTGRSNSAQTLTQNLVASAVELGLVPQQQAQQFVADVLRQVDTVAPVTSAAPSPLPPASAGGWNRTDVTVTLAADDGPNGSGVAATYYAVDDQACSPSSLSACTSVRWPLHRLGRRRAHGQVLQPRCCR